MYFSEEERKIQLTQKIIHNDLFGDDSWFQICGLIGILAMIVPLTIAFMVQTVERAFVKKIFDLEIFAYFLVDVIFLMGIIFIICLFIAIIKRFWIVKKGTYVVVEDQIDYLTLEEEVRYEGHGRYRRRVYVLVDILHFKQHGEYRIDNPCGHSGGDKFYLVISEDSGKIYNIYSQKTFYYR